MRTKLHMAGTQQLDRLWQHAKQFQKPQTNTRSKGFPNGRLWNRLYHCSVNKREEGRPGKGATQVFSPFGSFNASKTMKGLTILEFQTSALACLTSGQSSLLLCFCDLFPHQSKGLWSLLRHRVGWDDLVHPLVRTCLFHLISFQLLSGRQCPSLA